MTEYLQSIKGNSGSALSSDGNWHGIVIRVAFVVAIVLVAFLVLHRK